MFTANGFVVVDVVDVDGFDPFYPFDVAEVRFAVGLGGMQV